jgi:hypothetical protein
MKQQLNLLDKILSKLKGLLKLEASMLIEMLQLIVLKKIMLKQCMVQLLLV